MRKIIIPITIIGGYDMVYFKSARFLVLLFLIVTLIVGCVAMILVTRVGHQWQTFREHALPAGYWDETEEMQISNNAAPMEAWIVKAHGEQIGVFTLNGKLECVLDVYLITLPQADQALLREGIYVSGSDRLTALVEDYTG
jgi:hypothetical protein